MSLFVETMTVLGEVREDAKFLEEDANSSVGPCRIVGGTTDS